MNMDKILSFIMLIGYYGSYPIIKLSSMIDDKKKIEY